MSILLNGRQVEVILKVNGGSGSDGTELDISPYLLTLGDISWSVDENLTKLSLGNLSITTTDDDSNTVWTFLTSSLATSSGVLPPWIILNVDGVQRFIGIVKEAPTRNQEVSTLVISINAVDWSSMLESKRIKADDMAFKRSFKAGVAYATGTPVTCKSVYNKELRRGHDRNLVAIPTSEAANFSAGDSVYFANYDGWTVYNQPYEVLGTATINVGGLGVMYCLYLGSGFQWLERPANSANFGQTSTVNRLYKTTSDPIKNATDLPVFICQETYTVSTAGKTPKTAVVLNYVDGLLPGDVLDKLDNVINPGTFSITVVDVDPITKTVYLDSAINNDLLSGVTSFQLNKSSFTESVLFPLSRLVEASVLGLARIDYSSYSPALLPSPCFSFISPDSPTNQNTHTESLSGVSDVQTTLTTFQVQGTAGLAWSGLPATGWDALGTFTKTVGWTDQASSAPAYLMPYAAIPGDADPETGLTRGRTSYPGLYGDKGNTRTSDPAKGTSGTPVYKQRYDYSNFRLYTFRFNPGFSLTVQTYNGSSWSTVSGFSTSGVGSPVDVLPFKDTLSSVGSGYGLLALYKDGTVKTILSTVTLTNTLKGDVLNKDTGLLQANIIQTTNGIYYVTPTGYGQVYITGGVLTSKWVQILDISNSKNLIQSITPITNTFLFSNNRIITLAKVSYKTSITDERFIDDTYLLQLNKDVQEGLPEASVYSVDFIVKNIPRATMAVKSPVSEDIFGFMGSRLFQITKYLPDTVERFTAINQTASAMMEFVCAMSNTVAQPLVTGWIKLITRGHNNTVQNVTIDQVSMNESVWNQHMSSCVVIKGADEKKGIAVSTTQLSGLTISYSNDVYIRNSSQAKSIAQSYLAFFEKPRKQVQQVWFSQSFPAAWETLSPMDVITINGGSTQYYLIGLSHNLEKQTAQAQLLEVV